jgi:homoserine O-acetyltransferase
MADETTNPNSIGIVASEVVDLTLPDGGLKLRNGGVLREVRVAYEAYGKLSSGRDNVVYICHALTGDAHVAGYHSADDSKAGWWDEMVGPGKGIDTDYYHVICANVLGGCMGTTGPSSINPDTGKPYGSSFPDVTVADIVHVQKLLIDELNVNRLAAVVGGSLGGMQALAWSILYPDLVDCCICVASGATLSTQALAFDAVARDAIVSDPAWAGGDYYESDNGPDWGLAHARKIAHITYLSPESMQQKFGREKREQEPGSNNRHCFQVESYLDYQGKKLVKRFDANSYLQITQAVGAFDLAEEFGSLEKAFEPAKCKFLIIGLSTDWLFPEEQSIELAEALHRAGKDVSRCTLEAPHGHDAFLIEIDHLAEAVRAFLPWVTINSKPAKQERLELDESKAKSFNLILETVAKGSRVIDLGCGNGTLLSLLKEEKEVRGFGVDIDVNRVITSMDKGHNVLQMDLDEGLSRIPDGMYDYAILGSTLQVVRKPRTVLREMMRVAREGIITFPNFGTWSNRVTLALRGCMPKSDTLPHEWYDTPNIHLTTLKDFIELCCLEDIRIVDVACLPGDRFLNKLLVSMNLCNLGAEKVFVRVTGEGTVGQSAPSCRVSG